MKKLFVRLLLLTLASAMCFIAVSCDKVTDGEAVSSDTTDTPAVENSEETETQTEAPDPRAHLRVNAKWNFGYVASYLHEQTPDSIVDNGAKYSYTDVFTVAKAGTTVTFGYSSTALGDDALGSSDIYVFSQWKQENGEWVLIEDGANYIGGSSVSAIVAYAKNNTVIYSYTTSSDNEALRVCYPSGQTENYTPEEYTKIYAEHTGKAGTGIPIKYYDYYKNLEGVTLSAVGDSYFDGVMTKIGQENIWVNMLGEKYGMTYKVDGVGGATVSDARSDRDPVCERYQNILSNSDIVLLEGGRNDYNISGVGNNITLPQSVKDAAANSNTDIQVPLGDINSTDIQTFMGAWNVIITGVKAKCPDAMIVMISPWNFKDNTRKPITRQQYINAMKQIAEKHGVYFIDASDTSLTGVDMQSASFRSEYSISSTDESHLNAKGMAMVMPRFEKIISEYYADFLSKK